MAKLTETLNSVNSGKPIVDPGPAGPSVLGALANFGSGVAESFSQGLDLSNRMGARADQEAEARRQQQTRDALNAAAQSHLDVGLQATRDAESSRNVTMLNEAAAQFAVPTNVGDAARNLVRTMQAVRQGRVGPGTYDLQLEASMNTLFQQFPEQRAQIAQYFKSQGIDHYMFRALDADAQMAQTEDNAQAAAYQSQYNVAAEAGAITGEMPLEQGARRGRKIIARRAEIEANKAEYERMVSDRTLRREDLEAAKEELSLNTVNNMIAEYGQIIGPNMERMQLAIAGAGTDAERQAMLGEGRIAARAALEALRGRALNDVAATGNSADARKQVDEFFTNQISSLDALFDTSFEQNSAAARSLSSGLSIDMGRALPIYGRLTAALGQAGANAIINDLVTGVPGIDASMLQSARDEVRNFDPTNPRGTMSLARAIGYLRGDTNLRDLNAEEAPAYIRLNAAALRANQTALIGGNTAALRPWQVAFGNTVEATLELTPTTAAPEALARATTLFATPEARRALDIAVREDPEYGEALAMASRNAAAHTLNIAQRGRPEDGPFVIDYNTAQRQFRPVLTRQSYDRWAAQQNETFRAGRGAAGAMAGGMLPGNLGSVPSFEEMRRQIPTGITQRLTALNNSLAHLVLTDKYDEAIPSNLTGAERQRLYAEGATPASMARAGRSPTQATEFERLRSAATTGFQNLLTETVTAPRTENTNGVDRSRIMNYEARDVGIPAVPETVRTLGDASDFARQVNRAGADSSAMGTYQITGDTLRDFAPRVFGDNWTDVTFDATAQERIAEAIFNAAKHSADALRGRWVSLSPAEAERVRQLPWSQAKRIIAQGESG